MPQAAPRGPATPAPVGRPAALAQGTPAGQTLPGTDTPAAAAPAGSKKVSRWIIVAGVAIAGVAGFGLVFFLATRDSSDENPNVTPALDVTPSPLSSSGDALAVPSAPVAAAPTTPSQTTAVVPPPETATEAPPRAPRLPSVDPGPMPHEHAGAAATVDRYRQALSRGSRTRERGDLEGALQSYQFALQLKPRSEDATLGMARTYLDADQPADALRWAERARDIATRGIDARVLMGDALLRLGRYDQAIATWREAQAVAPRERAPAERIRRAEEARAGAGN